MGTNSEKGKSIRVRVTYLTENLAKIIGKMGYMIQRYPQVFESIYPN